MVTPSLASSYDTVLFDLDGVVYLGPEAIPAAVGACAELADQSIVTGFVTNNASRTPEEVAQHLRELGIDTTAEAVVTSAQAMAHLLASHCQPGDPVLVIGTSALTDELVRVTGIRLVESAQDNPVAVVQGISGDALWNEFCEAALAIQQGATWFVVNTDATRPTDRGLLPGCGAGVQAVRLAVSVDPIVAGKPATPLMQEAIQRFSAQRPLFTGDRTDTDIAGAIAAGIDSLLVFSGAHTALDLLDATEDRRPTHCGADASALVEPPRVVSVSEDSAICGEAQVSWRDDGYHLNLSLPLTSGQWCDAVWALAHLHWQRHDAGLESPASALVHQWGVRPPGEQS